MMPVFPSSSSDRITLSPTATGLVALLPSILNFPRSRQSYVLLSSANTLYQLPVDLTITPFNSFLFYFYKKIKLEKISEKEQIKPNQVIKKEMTNLELVF
jgi:hypothetical protein